MIKFVFLLTDFGLDDPYVAQMKMVIASELNCRIIDISHGIFPFSVLNGAFYLRACWQYLPAGSISLVVVDPGVGTDRDIVVCKASLDKFVIAPDNGVISWIFDDIVDVWRVDVSSFKEASATFHGRDIFAPLAIRIAKGDFSVLHKIFKSRLKRIDPPVFKLDNFRLSVRIIHIDRFGNCVLSIPSDYGESLFDKRLWLEKPRNVEICPVKTYSLIPKGKIGLLDGSQGFMELALKMGSCEEFLRVKIGDECVIRIKD